MQVRPMSDVVAQLKADKPPDLVEGSMFGFWIEVPLEFVTFDDAKAAGILKPGAEAWEAPLYTVASVTEGAQKYMEFAWGKVRDHRGISAVRSVEKIGMYMWLLMRDDVLRAMNEVGFAQYGAPKLKAACDLLKWPMPDGDGELRMARGLPCRPRCSAGCGT